MVIEELEVVAQIYKITSDVLKFLPGNRLIIEKHSDEIKQAIINGENMPPIIVDRKTLYIIDGQHRYEGFLKALDEGYDVYLEVIFKDFENPVDAARIYNTKSVNWKTADFVYSGISLEMDNYKKLAIFCDTHPYLKRGMTPKFGVAMALIFGKSIAGGAKALPEIITDEQLRRAEVLYNLISIIIDELGADKKTIFFTEPAIFGLIKFIHYIKETYGNEWYEVMIDFIKSGMNNRFIKPVGRSGAGVWFMYFQNMFTSYIGK